MSAINRHARAPLFATLGATMVVLLSSPAHAAQLTTVSGWNGGVSLPSDVTMSIYVPDKLAAKPPLVTVVHYCGGSASAVFGQAKDIKAAADKYGFIMIVPAQTHSGGCWDVSSKKSQTHDGGGDTHAIAQMVRYSITKYNANADRVYSTGDSSGAMMTQLLMAVYPDIFKAGSAFAGVPAGCSNVFDGSGLCGLSAQTAQQWGDRVRAMFPGYTGHRPRLQLVHGDADQTITYKNEAESVKEWTNVLGLTTDPTSKVDSGLTLGTHQAKRQQWKDSCGFVALDFLTSVGGDHGPSDALFQGNFVLPFLGLDSQAAVDAALDAQVVQCGAGGSTGGGGAGGSGGSGGTGGSASPGFGGAGGTPHSGTAGASASGGTSGAGVTGGTGATSGAPSAGGSSGGAVGTGGGSTTGVAGALTGSSGVAGALTGSSGAPGGASSGNPAGSDDSSSGCAIGASRPSVPTGIIGLALALLTLRRKRR